MSDRTEDGTDMTLAFEVSALEAVERPRRVFDDARTWSRHVGVVSWDPRAADRFAREHGLAQDFFTGQRGAYESLSLIEQQLETARYVFVGTSDDDRRAAEATGWEYRSIEEAAEAAGWELQTPPGALARLAAFFSNRW